MPLTLSAWVFEIGIGLALASPLSAQPPTPPADAKPQTSSTPTTLSVDARLVNLPVVVRDKNGALVENLTKADFALEVDGHPQTIRYFDRDANLPLTLGLLVDTSQSLRDALDDERSASSAFLDTMLVNPKDQAFVVQFARQVELLQDLTGSKPKLQAALKDLSTPSASSNADTSDTEDRTGHRNRAGGGTTLYDAVFLASDELMAKQKGRKALILLTDGNDRNSKESLTTAIETAQRGDTILYAIYFKGEQPRQDYNNGGNRGGYPGGGYPGGRYPGGGYPGGGYPGGGRGGQDPQQRFPEPKNDGKKILDRMTRETGGRMFEVSKKMPVDAIYTEIGKELRAQYRLGYTPDAATAADGYHKIDLSLTGADKKKITVQTREGYYTGK